MKVLIIGASGRIGSVALAACLKRGYTVTAFLRNPSKLPAHLRESEHSNLRIVKGDASSESDLREAMKDQDAIIQAAVYGSDSPWGTSDSERVVRTIVDAASSVQSERDPSKPPLRLWVMSGAVVLDVPNSGNPPKIQGKILPIHPEHHANHKYLKEKGGALDWSVLCPGKVDDAEPAGPLVHSINTLPLYHPPGLIGRLPFIGPLLNTIYNFRTQKLSYKSVGEFFADHLGPGEESGMRGMRVGLLEDWGAGPKS